MPLYDFYCPSCKHEQEIFSSMQDRVDGKKEYCEICGSELDRDFSQSNLMIGGRQYSKALHSDSLAIMPSQIEEHKQLFPNVEIDREGRPVFENFRQHENYLQKIGAVKTTQKIKPKGKKIA